jgi:hypothetical protein
VTPPDLAAWIVKPSRCSRRWRAAGRGYTVEALASETGYQVQVRQAGRLLRFLDVDARDEADLARHDAQLRGRAVGYAAEEAEALRLTAQPAQGPTLRIVRRQLYGDQP